jgi:hypothetical protein
VGEEADEIMDLKHVLIKKRGRPRMIAPAVQEEDQGDGAAVLVP